MTMIDKNRLAKEWAARGFSCDLWVDPPGQRWEDFRHRSDEIVTVMEGEMEFVIEGKVVRPAVGCEVFIPAGALHSVRNIGGSTARWLYGYRR